MELINVALGAAVMAVELIIATASPDHTPVLSSVLESDWRRAFARNEVPRHDQGKITAAWVRRSGQPKVGGIEDHRSLSDFKDSHDRYADKVHSSHITITKPVDKGSPDLK
jgi:hypothetical protein